MRRLKIRRSTVLAPLLATLVPCSLATARGQATPGAKAGIIETQPLSPRTWADAGAANEILILEDEGGSPLRYRMRKVDRKGDTTREVIETREGNVARLVERDGGPLSAEEDAGERERLNGILQSPDTFLKHRRRDRESLKYGVELIHNLPPSMLWSFAAGQPQLGDVPSRQIVLDFTPDPKYKPPTLVTESLTGVAGRVWIDAGTRRVSRIQGHVLHPVDFGWGGVLARVNPGGTVEFTQTQAGPGRWLTSHMEAHLSIREVLVHTVTEDLRMQVSDVQPLPAAMSFQEAIRFLLGLPVKTR